MPDVQESLLGVAFALHLGLHSSVGRTGEAGILQHSAVHVDLFWTTKQLLSSLPRYSKMLSSISTCNLPVNSFKIAWHTVLMTNTTHLLCGASKLISCSKDGLGWHQLKLVVLCQPAKIKGKSST